MGAGRARVQGAWLPVVKRRLSAISWWVQGAVAANFLGPMLLGRLFDTVGRKIMVSLTYLSSAVVAGVLALRLLGNTLTE